MLTDLFMANSQINVVLTDGAFMPTRAHSEDAGLDLYAREGAIVPAGGSKVFDTGVCIELPEIKADCYGVPVVLRTAGFLKSKSGLNINHDIISDGVIDVGYSGSIAVKLYNLGDKDYEVKRGDKISQLCIEIVLTPAPRQVDKLQESERGTGGFGSTGR